MRLKVTIQPPGYAKEQAYSGTVNMALAAYWYPRNSGAEGSVIYFEGGTHLYILEDTDYLDAMATVAEEQLIQKQTKYLRDGLDAIARGGRFI